jgi:hypothetical protein
MRGYNPYGVKLSALALFFAPLLNEGEYCPHFQQVLAKVQKRVDELRPLGYTELKQIESQVSGDKLHSEMP